MSFIGHPDFASKPTNLPATITSGLNRSASDFMMQAKKMGMSAYGDPDYVEHVLRYYPFGNPSYGIVNTGTGKLGLPIQNMKKGNITSPFGHRSSPGGI